MATYFLKAVKPPTEAIKPPTEPVTASPAAIPKLDDEQASTSAIATLVNANNQFAFDLYNKYKNKPENLFFSSYSIQSAFGMVYEGAKGVTSEEIAKVFYLPKDDMSRRASFAKIYNDINQTNKDFQLTTANALWAEKTFTFLDSYLNTVEKYYGGKLTNLDFIGAAEKARVTINDWVASRTNGKIKDLIPEGILGIDTKLVLTNAIYFKGDWVKAFNKDATKEADFYTSSDTTVKTLLMESRDTSYKYSETSEAQILEMPYTGDKLSMLVILPTEKSLDNFEKSLSITSLDEWQKDLAETDLDVYLPKFKLQTKYYMAQDLAEMGMPTSFSDSADFSGMDGNKDLYISDVIHQAYVDVYEEGTEAAAATAVVMKMMGMPTTKPVFKADHPFIFLIKDDTTGNILFMGRMIDPTR